jgi:WD40 repeat protein
MHMLRTAQKGNKKILITHNSGSVSVYNLKLRKVEFVIEAGHAETVFDLKFCASNKNKLASCSFDGSVRMWDVQSMKIKSVIDTRHNSPI